MFENYKKYLDIIDSKLEKFHEKQKPYIFCKKGCAKCCKNAQFPYSLIEFKYLLQGFLELDKETQDKIESNIKEVALKRKDFQGKGFLYDCPFLINDICSVYKYRGIVCRTFGLLYNGDDGKVKVPFCCYEGYNYSNVLDKEKNKITQEKVDESGFDTEPLGFNISYKFLTSETFEKGFGFEFGDKKSLIDWFMENK